MPEYLVNWTCTMNGQTTIWAEDESEVEESLNGRDWGALADDAGSPAITIESVEDVSGPDGCSEAKKRRENKR